MRISTCSPSPTSRRKTAARPFHKTGMLARQTGVIFLGDALAGRELRWPALRGSPPGRRVRPVITVAPLWCASVSAPRHRPPHALEEERDRHVERLAQFIEAAGADTVFPCSYFYTC